MFFSKKNKLFTPYSLLITQNAFTVIELLVVVSISIVVSAAGFLGLANFNASQNIKNALQGVESALVFSQKRSVTQQDGKTWGIRFANTTSSDSQYTLFKGLSYAAGTTDRAYNLGKNISFTNPFSSSTYDAIFTALTGRLSANKVVTIASSRKDGMIGDIVLNSIGRVTTRKESGVMGYWHFDENTATTTYDASGFTNTGTATGTTWTAASSCKAGTCLSFDGTDDHVFVSSPTYIDNTAGTVAMWAKFNNTTQYANLWSISVNGATDDEMRFDFRGDSAKELQVTVLQNGVTVNFSGLTTANAVTDTNWHFFAITSNGSTIKLYIDGVERAIDQSIAGSNTGQWFAAATDANVFTTGALKRASILIPFAGLIDEARIYNRALSATEILNMYNDLR